MPNLGEPANLILVYIYRNPYTTTRDVSKNLKLPQPLISRYIKVLHKYKLIGGIKSNLDHRRDKYEKTKNVYKWFLTAHGLKYLLLRIVEHNIDKCLYETNILKGDMK